MTVVLTGLTTHDIRFPTSLDLAGSDAMNPDPDYSVAYVVLHGNDGSEGHGFVFTIGRGTEVQRAAIDALEPLVVGRRIGDHPAQLGEFARALAAESQLRWLGPDKGVTQMAVGAVVNAAWDLVATRSGLPLWQLLSELDVEDILDLVDFRYLDDVLNRELARELLTAAVPGRADRRATLLAHGYPAYTTSPGWLGYDDDQLVALCRKAVTDGFEQIKLKVGADAADDRRRTLLARRTVGDDVRIAVDANQRWGVDEAITAIADLADIGLAWVEEPTHPDDVLGHARIAEAIAPIPVAAGEHVPNAVMFKQLLAAGSISVCQLDACRTAGVNENIAIMLLAAKFGVPVCPHAGGVGLCEAVQHLAMFDYVAISGDLHGRCIEHVDSLHEHFEDPVEVVSGRYCAPTRPGASTRMKPRSIAAYAFPDGAAWSP